MICMSCISVKRSRAREKFTRIFPWLWIAKRRKSRDRTPRAVRTVVVTLVHSDMSLAPKHLEDLRKSNLTDEMIQLMGVSSVPPAEITRLSQNLKDVESLLEFPYPYVEPPFSRYKKFPTPADGSKYFQPAETRNHLYILPPVKEYLSDPSIKLCGIEGEKKTALGVQMGLRAFGVSGVWGWL